MCATGFLPVLCTVHFLACLIEQIFKFNGFNEVGVPDHTTVCDSNIFELLPC